MIVKYMALQYDEETKKTKELLVRVEEQQVVQVGNEFTIEVSNERFQVIELEVDVKGQIYARCYELVGKEEVNETGKET